MYRLRTSLIGVATLAALAGCGGDGEPPRMFLTLAAAWNDAPPNQQTFGYTLTMHLHQWRVRDRCDAWPAPMRFTIDDEEVGPLVPDPISGCFDSTVVVGPTLDVRDTVTVRHETNGRLLATATYHHLAPGLTAALAVPADGQAHVGDEIVVVPPPELPTSGPSDPRFYRLDGAQGSSAPEPPVRPNEPATRLPDGIHVKIPSVTGRVALLVNGTAFNEAEVSCDGFAACSGQVAAVIGPVHLTVQP